MRRLFLLLILGGCAACMSIEGPQPTEAGWLMLRYAESGIDANRALVQQALRFDEYVSQTTDEGRKEVHDRYFPRERIVEREGVWQVLSSHEVWTFELRGGKPLGEAGCEWKVACVDERENSLGNAVIGDAGEGELAVSSEIPLLRFRTRAQVVLRVSYGENGTQVFEYRSGDVRLQGLKTPRLDVDCTIAEPLIYRNQAAVEPEEGGQLSLTAHNEADNADESAEARYLTHGEVEITYCGKVGIWNRHDSGLE